MNWNTRTEMIIGEEGTKRLSDASVLLFGVGGVGSYAAEALARAGVGRITLVDGDRVAETNINRQLIALRSTVGMYKADAMALRIKDINPAAEVIAVNAFYTRDDSEYIDFNGYDYVLDAIDMVSAKLLIAEKCFTMGIPEISSMGTGNKLDPSLFRVCDIFETENCPLARVMRKELRHRNIDRLTVVFSPEEPVIPQKGEGKVGSVSFVPSVAGLMLAGKAIRDIAGV